MDFQRYVDGFKPNTSIISVEKINDDEYGEIRIVAGNKIFIDMVEHPMYSMGEDKPRKFIPNSLYYEYIPKSLNYEDACFKAAVHEKTIHTYVRVNVGQWMNIILIPIDYKEGNKYFCSYSVQPTDIGDIDPDSMSSFSVASDVLQTCIKLHATKDFKETLREVIRDIRNICNAEICTLMLTDEEKATCKVLATSRSADSKMKPISQVHDLFDLAMSWKHMIGEGDCIIIKNQSDMAYYKTENPEWYETLVEAGVESVVLFSLTHDNQVLGYIWATNFDTADVLRIKEVLELTTFFLSSEISSYKMMDRLEYLSFTDLLTGVHNRNALNVRLNNVEDEQEEKKEEEESYGVVFADLNGLKRVNDMAGHTAGDLLLKKAALILQESFVGDDVYRIGGDEFVVIVNGGDKDAFDLKVNALRRRSDGPEKVSFSVGSCFCENGIDIKEAVNLADEESYKDKDRYYKENPEKKYRIAK